MAGYEENLGEPLRAVREDVEKEWIAKVEEEKKKREEKEIWAEELVRQLDKEKKVSQSLRLLQLTLTISNIYRYAHSSKSRVALFSLSSSGLTRPPSVASHLPLARSLHTRFRVLP